jgi:hypothetical protein
MGTNREMVVRALFDLALAHARIEELGEALNLALQCEQAINSQAIATITGTRSASCC